MSVVFTINISKKYIYCVLVGLLITFLSSFLQMEHIAPLLIVLIGVSVGIFLILLCPQEDRNFLITIFVLTFSLRILASLFLYNIVFLLKGRGLLGDSWFHSETAYAILNLWLKGIKDLSIIQSQLSLINIEGYQIWSAFVYFFTRESPLCLVFINCLAGSLTFMFVYFIAKQLSNTTAARYAAILTAFWPSLIFWSMQNLKESTIVFLICALIWGILSFKNQFRFYLVFLILAFSIILKEFRLVSFFIFYTVILPISMILFLWRRNRILFISLIIFTGLGAFVIVNKYVLKFLPQNQNIFSLLEYINYIRTVRAYGNTAFLSNFDITNLTGFIFFAPVALLVAWLAPFPWQIGSMSQIAAIPEMLLYYLLLLAMFVGWRFIMRYKIREGGLIIAYIFIMMLVLAFIDGNIGTLFRHRSMILPLYFVLAAIGLERHNFKITAHN